YSCSYLLLFLMLRRYPLVTLFPYTTLFRSYEAFSARLSSNGVNVALRGKNISYAFLDANQKQRRARGVRLGTNYDKEALLDELARREQQTRKQTEISNDQRALTADREMEQRKPLLESRKPGLDRLAVATGQSEEHTSELQSRFDIVCRLLLEKKNTNQ